MSGGVQYRDEQCEERGLVGVISSAGEWQQSFQLSGTLLAAVLNCRIEMALVVETLVVTRVCFLVATQTVASSDLVLSWHG